MRFRLTPERRRAWEELCRKKKISQQEAANALLAWIDVQDDLVQSMVLGQIAPDAALVTWVLHKLAGQEPAKQEHTAVKFPPPSRK